MEVIQTPKLSQRPVQRNENYASSEVRRVGFVRDFTETLEQQKLLIVPKFQLERHTGLTNSDTVHFTIFDGELKRAKNQSCIVKLKK